MGTFESFIGVNPWTALFTLLNTLALFYVMKKFLFKPVLGMIEARQKEIDDLYADANNAKNAARQMELDYQTRIAQSNAEGDRIVKDAVTRAQGREEEIIQAANAKAEAIRQKAAADIALEKKKAMNEIKDDISGIAVSIAEKVVEKEIDEKQQQKLIASFIDQLG